LTWSLYYLGKLPEVERTLAAEIAATLGDRDAPTYDDLDRMPYLNAFVKEVRRTCLHLHT
jgi:cytochrome P450